ncbi:MAG: hypothetical protein L6R41_006784 [Letrouitia leprolyta]|nr:MAG: hypothetical protein L6R41_006784 [Letrouitia leprolyta]
MARNRKHGGRESQKSRSRSPLRIRSREGQRQRSWSPDEDMELARALVKVKRDREGRDHRSRSPVRGYASETHVASRHGNQYQQSSLPSEPSTPSTQSLNSLRKVVVASSDMSIEELRYIANHPRFSQDATLGGNLNYLRRWDASNPKEVKTEVGKTMAKPSPVRNQLQSVQQGVSARPNQQRPKSILGPPSAKFQKQTASPQPARQAVPQLSRPAQKSSASPLPSSAPVHKPTAFPREISRSRATDAVPPPNFGPDAAFAENKKRKLQVVDILKERAASDHDLQALMKAVASGNATNEQRRQYRE